MSQSMAASELVLAPDGSLYHIRLQNDELNENVILVGEPERVAMVSDKFDTVTLKRSNRGIIIHSGSFKGKKVSVVATGMGVGNIDIILTELDAAVNINLRTKQINPSHQHLNFIRIGTCGSMQADVGCNQAVASRYVVGIDGSFRFYNAKQVLNERLTDDFVSFMKWDESFPRPYAVEASQTLINNIAFDMQQAITITAPGFYAAQGRKLRLELADDSINDRLPLFCFNGIRVVNYEMEASMCYALGRALGHSVLAVCNVVANRASGEFVDDYSKPMNDLIEKVLERL
ncbi:MAG: nucleoside phosphorylase [Bacteroidales bacterium]|jgi:uridine phosphorylase|nr:nucleoside phosphorylase [Bacteroidales bacterium]